MFSPGVHNFLIKLVYHYEYLPIVFQYLFCSYVFLYCEYYVCYIYIFLLFEVRWGTPSPPLPLSPVTHRKQEMGTWPTLHTPHHLSPLFRVYKENFLNKESVLTYQGAWRGLVGRKRSRLGFTVVYEWCESVITLQKNLTS